MFKLYCVCLFLLLNGCATCERYPVACAVSTAIVVGSVAATIEANRHDHAPAKKNCYAIVGASFDPQCIQYIGRPSL